MSNENTVRNHRTVHKPLTEENKKQSQMKKQLQHGHMGVHL